MNTLHKIGIVLVAFIALFLFSCKSNQSTMATTEKDNKTVFKNIDASDEEQILITIVEDTPLFNGKPADEEFRNYVNENVKCPYEYYAHGSFYARIFVEFFIDTDGSVTDAKVLRGFDPILDAEALRVINSSPKWTPGEQRGKPVKVRYVFPVVFK